MDRQMTVKFEDDTIAREDAMLAMLALRDRDLEEYTDDIECVFDAERAVKELKKVKGSKENFNVTTLKLTYKAANPPAWSRIPKDVEDRWVKKEIFDRLIEHLYDNGYIKLEINEDKSNLIRTFVAKVKVKRWDIE